MSQIQSKYGLPLSCVYKEDKQEYIEALENSRKIESIDPFREFMDSQYRKYLSQEIQLYRSQHQDKSKGISFIF